MLKKKFIQNADTYSIFDLQICYAVDAIPERKPRPPIGFHAQPCSSQGQKTFAVRRTSQILRLGFAGFRDPENGL